MTADNVGGVWTYALDLAQSLSARDVAVHLAVMGRPVDDDQRRELDATGVRAWEARPYPLEWMPDPWDGIDRAGRWLLDLADGADAHLVHLNGYAHAALAWDRPVLVVGHSCVRSWWRAVRRTDAPPSWRRYGEVVAAGLNAADLVVAPTGSMLEALEENYAFTGDSLVIPNGTDVVARGGDKERLVLAAGRSWDEAKNLSTVVEAARSLDAAVVIAGDDQPGPMPGDPPNLRRLGRVTRTHLEGWMARATVFCAPVRYEPFGLAALEAARCGCALVLGDVASLREVWDRAATFVDPDDARSLTTALSELLDDDNVRSKAAKAAGQRSLRFDVPTMARRYLDAYVRLVKRGSGALVGGG